MSELLAGASCIEPQIQSICKQANWPPEACLFSHIHIPMHPTAPAPDSRAYTLHSSLRAQTSQRAHGAHHKVRKDAGSGLSAGLVPVCGEGGDIGGFGGALEGGVEAGRRLVAGLHGGARRPRDGQLVGGPCAGYRAGGVGEGGHRGCVDGGVRGTRGDEVGGRCRTLTAMLVESTGA
jgi:hypothetical protein